MLDSVSPDQSDMSVHTHLVVESAKSVKWSILYNVLPRLVTPFSKMILAALLTPVDFGLVSISTFIIALAVVVVDFGLGKTLIQRKTNVNEAASISFLFNLFVSLGLYYLLWVLAPGISAAYRNENVVSVIRVAALHLPLNALAATPKAILRRNMQFNRLFWFYSTFMILQAVTSVLLALTGIGYWALIWGELIGMAVSTAIVWGQVKWRPTIMVDWPIFRSMLGFSVWVMISAFQNWLILYSDNAIAGLYLGMQGLGVYALGFNIATLIPGFLTNALGDVAYPAFCKLKGDVDSVGQSLLNLQRLTGAILFPVTFMISAVAISGIELLYGNKWQGLGMVISILVIMPGLSSIWSLNEFAYQSVERPDIWTKLSGFSLLILIPSLWIAAPQGLLVFTLVRFGAALLLPLGNILIGGRFLTLRVSKQVGALASPFSMAMIMFLVMLGLSRVLEPFTGLIGWIKLIAVIIVGATVYIVLLWKKDRELWDQIFLGIHRIISR